MIEFPKSKVQKVLKGHHEYMAMITDLIPAFLRRLNEKKMDKYNWLSSINY